VSSRVCVLGTGLIGGSVLRAATAAGWIGWGWNRTPVDAQGFDVTTDLAAVLARAATEDALVVLAVPVTALDEVLRAVAEHAPGCALTDVVSVKAPVAGAVARHGLAARFVGGHPMAGTSESGWDAGSASLFAGAAWVVAADDGLDPDTWLRVARLALDCGAHVVPAAAAEHDAAVARISHLPHLLAAVLASVGAEGGALALGLGAGSFRDGTRVAGTRPELTRAMLEANRAGLQEALDDALGRLGAARGALASTGTVAATVEDGHDARRLFTEHERFDITDVDPTDLRALREAGRAGGVLRTLG
jgi:prephenate dehydrogenase